MTAAGRSISASAECGCDAGEVVGDTGWMERVIVGGAVIVPACMRRQRASRWRLRSYARRIAIRVHRSTRISPPPELKLGHVARRKPGHLTKTSV